MEVKLQKWGNSVGIRIPSGILKSLNLKSSDIVDLNLIDDKIVISHSICKKKISLRKRFMSYKGKNLAKDFVWDDAVGDEIW